MIETCSKSSVPPRTVTQGATPGAARGWFARLRARLWRRNGDATVREAIGELIDEGEDGGEAEIDADERILIANILQLHQSTAQDVMVPRAEIFAVEAETSLDELLALLAEQAHSRIPIYRNKLDEVIGFVHIKDVLAALHKKSGNKVADLARDILFAAPSIQVLDLLLEMRAARLHMAIVVDEFGGVDGLVTIEDLVEEIVGEIEDEHDEEGPSLTELGDGSIIADARTRIEELEEITGPFASDTEREEIDTLGGIVFSTIDRVPRRAEVIAHPSGLEFEVVEADARRIRKLRVLLPHRATAATARQADKNQGRD